MRKLFTFLVAFLATLSGAVWGQYKATIDLNNPQDGSGVDWLNNNFIGRYPCFRIVENGTYLVTGSSSENYIEIGSRAAPIAHVTDVTLVFQDVTMSSPGLDNRGPIWVYNPGNNGDEPLVKIQLKGKNRITNPSGEGAAININNNANLIIEDADNLDGILYVEGNVGIGNPNGSSGAIQINGGTVVAKGAPGIGGTAEDKINTFTLNGNAFVVTNGQRIKPDLTKGIFCNEEEGNVATVYGNVLLNSTYPDNEDYKLKIDDNGTLTLAAGYTLPKDRMADIQADQARFKAYEIEWISNSIGADKTESSLPELFYGPNTEVTNGVSYTCKNGQHLPIGWLNGDATNVVTSVSTSSNTPNNLTTVRVGCAWIDASRTIYGTTKKPLTDATLRVYPESVSNVSFKDDDSKLPEGISLLGKVLSGTATSAGKTEVPLTAYLDETTKVEGKATTVTFEIQEETDFVINTKDPKNNVHGESVYDGKVMSHEVLEDQYIDVYFTQDKGQGGNASNKYFDIVSCTYQPYTDEEGSLGTEETGVTEIKKAGVYKNFIIKAAEDQDVSLNEGSTYTITSGSFTIKKATVTVTPTTLEANESDTESLPTIEYTTKSTVDSKVEIPNVTGTLALQTEEGQSVSDLKTPGVYNIVQGTVKMEKREPFDPSNYTLMIESKKFTIKDDISDNTNITVSVTGADNLIYKGSAYNVSDYVTVGGLEEDTYEVIVKKDDEKVNLRNADTYSIVLTGKGTAFGEYDTKKTITIKPKEIKSIKATDQSVTIGNNPDLVPSETTITIDELIGEEKPVYAGNNLMLDSKVDINIKGEYIGALSIQSLDIKDNDDEGFLKSNYSGWDEVANNYGKGTLTVTDDSGIDIDIPEEGEIEVDENGNVSFPYDGKNHNNFFADKKITVKYTEGEKKETLELGASDYQVTWKKDNSEWTSTEEPWIVGTYVAKITVTKDDPAIKDKSTVRTITVTKRSLSAIIKPQTIETAGASIKTEANGNVTIVNPVKTETAVLTGSLKVKDGLTLQAGHIYKGAIVKDNFTLTNGTDQNGFNAANYELNDENITAGDLTVKQATNPTDPEDIIPGDGDKDWTWNPTQKAYTMIYDGLEHGITSLKIKLITVGTDGEKTEKYETVNITDVDYKPNKPKDFQEKGYTATVTIPTNEYIKNGTASLKLMILKRDMTLDFHLPQSLTEGETPNWNAKTAITFTNLANPKGKEETPTIKDECRLVIENGKAVLKGYPYIANNTETGFNTNNYTVDYKNNGQDITIEPDGDGDVEIPEIPVNPDEGGDGGDGQDPTKYYNIYDVTEYDFIDVSFSRNVVREGGSVNVYLGIPEGLDPAAVTLMFKRSLYGGWENLNTDDDGNYLINNIWTDIYVKAVVDESYIDPNPDENHIYIDLSETNDSIWLYTERKLVEEGKTAVIQAEVAKSCQNKEIRYMYKRTVLGEWKEMPKDYSINQYVVRDITTDIYVKAYFVFDKQDPTTAKNPHHVYADITATSEGLYLDATRHKVADEGDTKVFLYVKKGFETKDARYLFKRGLKGEWEDLVPGIEQNTFEVTNIEEDIYLKGIDAIYTGTEDIDGMVRVYTKDGSLFVYTAQPEEISVVSMTGVTVKRTRQTGLQSYPLNQGIYVVCVGEQVFKVRVK